MHFNFGFTTIQVLWTLTFAALLVLLVVLLGRDRARRYPWFTTRSPAAWRLRRFTRFPASMFFQKDRSSNGLIARTRTYNF